MLLLSGILLNEIVLGVTLIVLLFAPIANAEMRSDPSSKPNTESQSDRSKTPTQPGQTDITNTPGDPGNLPSRYTVMPVARGEKIDVESSLIGDTVKNPKGEQLGRLERLIKDSETQKIEYAMISIGDTGEYKAFPWSNFKVNKEQGNVVLNVTRAVTAWPRTNRSLTGRHESGGRSTEDAPSFRTSQSRKACAL
ncbi:MAG TPA: PRC-barrel domain-containing protein [Nitrospiraceae bacterium]|nr:PRC-barrel domain-containing protein [Nitrospiraceae bacterium]